MARGAKEQPTQPHSICCNQKTIKAAAASAGAATAGLAAFFNATPTPSALATDLSTATSSSLALPGSTAILSAGLAAQATVLDSPQFNGAAGDGATLKTWVTDAKAAIAAAVGNFNSLVTARDAYLASPSVANYDALAAAAKGVGSYQSAPATAAVATKLGEQDSAPSAATNYQAPSAATKAAGDAAAAGLGPYVAAARAAVAAVPTLSGYSAALAAVSLPPATVGWGGAGSRAAVHRLVLPPADSNHITHTHASSIKHAPRPAPQTFDAPQAALDALEAAAVTQGDAVKGQVASALASFSGATGQLQGTVIGGLEGVQVGELGWGGVAVADRHARK
jgi:hypothetical protein